MPLEKNNLISICYHCPGGKLTTLQSLQIWWEKPKKEDEAKADWEEIIVHS